MFGNTIKQEGLSVNKLGIAEAIRENEVIQPREFRTYHAQDPGKLIKSMRYTILSERAYSNGYKEAIGEIPDGTDETNKEINNEFSEDYFKGFMIGLGEKDIIK